MEKNNNPELLSLESTSEVKKESFLTTKIKNYMREKPKQAFLIMFSLVVLSLIITLIHLFYVHQVGVPKYREMKKRNIFESAENSFTAPVAATQNAMELKKVVEELQYYKQKDILTKRDSIRIKYLLAKYQINPKK